MSTSVKFRPAYLAQVGCDSCGESMKDVMILKAGEKQIVLCGKCLSGLDGMADEISYFQQFTYGEEEE